MPQVCGVCGVLALQGDYAKHRHSLERCGVPGIEVRSPQDLSRCERLILPGGESSTMYRLMFQAGLWQALQQRIAEGMPIFGTCAGMILLAREVVRQDERALQNYGPQPCLQGIELSVNRNAYGRQIASFSTAMDLKLAPENPLHPFLRPEELQLPLIFIRAPQAVHWSKKVHVLLRYQEQAICLQQGKVLVCSFHPELSENTLLHRYFLSL